MKKALNPQSINETKAGEIGIFQTMIVSGPVIVQPIDGVLKTLLVKHGDQPITELKWKFCGGKLLKGFSLRENAIRESKEEIGVKIKIIDDLPTLELWNEIPETGNDKPELIVLVHYLAEINKEPQAGPEIIDMQWFNINSLPDNCSPNVKPIIDYYKQKYIVK